MTVVRLLPMFQAYDAMCCTALFAACVLWVATTCGSSWWRRCATASGESVGYVMSATPCFCVSNALIVCWSEQRVGCPVMYKKCSSVWVEAAVLPSPLLLSALSASMLACSSQEMESLERFVMLLCAADCCCCCSVLQRGGDGELGALRHAGHQQRHNTRSNRPRTCELRLTAAAAAAPQLCCVHQQQLQQQQWH